MVMRRISLILALYYSFCSVSFWKPSLRVPFGRRISGKRGNGHAYEWVDEKGLKGVDSVSMCDAFAVLFMLISNLAGNAIAIVNVIFEYPLRLPSSAYPTLHPSGKSTPASVDSITLWRLQN